MIRFEGGKLVQPNGQTASSTTSTPTDNKPRPVFTDFDIVVEPFIDADRHQYWKWQVIEKRTTTVQLENQATTYERGCSDAVQALRLLLDQEPKPSTRTAR